MLQIRTLMVILALPASAQSLIQFHGYLQARFTDQPGTSDRLEIRRARLIVSGDPLPGFSFKLQGDFAKSPYLMDAFLGYRFSRQLALSLGQMKIPFSGESLVSDDQNAPVSRSRAVLTLAPGRDTGVQGRDVGALVSGAIGSNGHSLDYSGGVFRGQTLVHAPRVHDQATALRIVGHPFRGVSIAANWYSSFKVENGPVKRREDLEGSWQRGRMRIAVEEILARDGLLKRRGGYLEGVWRVAGSWEALMRADWLNTAIEKPNAGSIAYIAGANVFLLRHVKIGFDAGAQHDSGPKGWGSIMLAQIMPFF
jgi:phosphate-selective porin OprO/OprP